MTEIKQVIVVRTDLNMRKGKLAAQVAHAAMAFLMKGSTIQVYPFNELQPKRFSRGLTDIQAAWLQGSFTKVVVSVPSLDDLQAVIEKGRAANISVQEIVDNGLTEFHGVRTLTCAAFGPDHVSRLDPITGGLKLL